jgi:Chromo (CHRromatin Organisation MOdifier) domain
MFLNAFTDRSRPSRPKGGRKQRFAFDFVVAERPIYVPGSGPPLAPLTVMPVHDKDGIIEGEVKMNGQQMYIVSYEPQPYLRVGVKPQNILDWVSSRTFEEWEDAKTRANDQAEMAALLPKIAAREQRKLLKERGANSSRAATAPKKTWSRKRKRPPTPEPPPRSSRKRRGVDTEEEEAVITNPRRPSLSTPTKQRGLADLLDVDSEEEHSFAEETAEFLNRQLNGTRGRSKLAIELARSATTSPEPKKINKLIKPPFPTFDGRETRSGSISSTHGAQGRETRSSSASGPSHQDSVAAMSSRQARLIYEKLERKSQAKAGSLTKTYSYSGKPPSSSQRLAATNPTRQKSETPRRKKSVTPKTDEEEDEDDESEYEVETILADEYRLDKKQNPVLWYLIKWVGDWDHTWEPAANVGKEAIAEYQAKKAAANNKKKPVKKKTSFDEEMENTSDDVLGIDPKDKGPQKIPSGSGGREDRTIKDKGKIKVPFGSGGIDLTGDDSDPDSLFVKGQSPFKGISKKAPIQKRDMVIDDASASDEF